MNKAKRTSLFKIVFFIVSVTMTFVVAIIAVLFSIFGNDLYTTYKSDDLMSKAKAISQQMTKLYLENADRNTVARMVYSDEYSVPDSSTYVYENNGNWITNADRELLEEATDGIDLCIEKVLRDGAPVSFPRASVGIVIGAPIYNENNSIIGVVILIHRGSAIQDRMHSLALQFGLIMLAILLIALVPSVLVFRFVTQPIKNVSETALAMANGDLDARAVPKGSFESQHLAESFNTLADALKSNIDHLVVERNRLGTVIDGIGEGIIAMDKHGDITHFNSAALKLLGGSESDLPSELPNYDEVAAIVTHSFKSDSQQFGTVSVSDRLLRITATPIHEANGALVGAVTLISDVTESERLEQTRRDYVANVSHELRTPLASIRSLSDALCDGLITEETDQKRYYGYIQREAIRLSHLIDDLLELSRLQSGGVAFSKDRVDLYEIAYDVADMMNDLAHKRGKFVRLDIVEGEYYGYTNADRIEQVLIALTDNAVKHGIDGCCVALGMYLRSEDNRYVFTVSNLAEIERTDIEHIFDRFYKADHAHSGEGTGLGLAIVYEVLNLLGESINVDYKDGMICFSFTVERCKRGYSHPKLSIRSSERNAIDPAATDAEKYVSSANE